MPCYLHRISHEKQGSLKLHNNGILTIGFLFDNKEQSERMLCEARKEKNYSNFINYFVKLWGEEWRSKRSKASLWWFAQIKKDDLVVVPLDYGYFSIYKAKGCAKPIYDLPVLSVPDTDIYNNKLYKNQYGALSVDSNGSTKELDLGYYIEVEEVALNLRRSAASSDLQSSMKFRGTTNKLEDESGPLADELIAFENNSGYSGLEDKIDIFGSEVINEVVPKLRHFILRLNSDQFEELVSKFFEKIGASESEVLSKRQRKQAGNEISDSDVRAEFFPLKLVINVQVKHHFGQTDSHAELQIKDFASQEKMIAYEQKEGWSYLAWVVTSAESFNDEAIDLAKKDNVRLIAIDEFCEMLLQAGIDLN